MISVSAHCISHIFLSKVRTTILIEIANTANTGINTSDSKDFRCAFSHNDSHIPSSNTQANTSKGKNTINHRKITALTTSITARTNNGTINANQITIFMINSREISTIHL